MSTVLHWVGEHWFAMLLFIACLCIGVLGLFGLWIFNTNDDEHGDW